ncbi:MAG: glycolate oxidase subunit GlcE [Gammaproteobacteria bacterium]|nr:glycolate oxidase subunit GlcE [Gammaproteobacteria bacterium]
MPDLSRQLTEQIQTALTDGARLNIVGGGSKSFMGRALDNVIPLHTGGHSGIVSYQPVELVLTARAGTRLDEIEQALDEQGQMLSFQAPHYASGATIGGTLACNQSGPARPWWGSVRDQVLGIRLLNGRGEHLRFGGQVMKNVAGYDVSRLQAGAMGCLGVITEISLKVMPKPAHVLTLVEEMPVAEAIDTMNRLSTLPKPLAGACWYDGHLYLRLAGARSAVDATAKQWGYSQLEEGETFWRDLRDHKLDFFLGDTPLWRFSVKPTAQPVMHEADWLIDWGGAQRWVRARDELISMAALAETLSGKVSLFKGGDRHGEVNHPQATALQSIQQRLKYSFDPKHLFNPGRLYTWL